MPKPKHEPVKLTKAYALINFAMRRYKRADGIPLIAYSSVVALKEDWVQLKPHTSRILDNRVGAIWSSLHQWRTEAYKRDSLAGIDLVMFLLLTGCRLNEATTLTWDRVHLPNGSVTACHYLETSRLGYLYSEAQRIADWIEEQAVKVSGANVLPLRA